jgi:acetoacetate decarboxylase
VQQVTTNKPKELQLGEGEITFDASDYDPWHEVEVVKMLGATYMRGDIIIQNGKVLSETEFMDFLPFAFLKWDMK